MHDFDPVAFDQRMRGVQAARDDFAIHFHRDPAFGKAFRFEQDDDAGTGVDAPGLAVQFDIHPRILPDAGEG